MKFRYKNFILKFIILIISFYIILLIFSCRNKKDAVIIQQNSFKNQNDEKAFRLKLINDGNKLRYIIKFRLSQSHFTINIFEHIKDKMNAVDFEIPVDEIFYDSVNIGSKIVNEFRTGSFILSGSFGNWNMNVIDKRIEKEKSNECLSIAKN